MNSKFEKYLNDIHFKESAWLDSKCHKCANRADFLEKQEDKLIAICNKCKTMMPSLMSMTDCLFRNGQDPWKDCNDVYNYIGIFVSPSFNWTKFCKYCAGSTLISAFNNNDPVEQITYISLTDLDQFKWRS